MNRAPAATQAASKDSVSSAFISSTVNRSPLVLDHVSPRGSGKLGQSPSVSRANSIQSLISGDESVNVAAFSRWRAT